MSLDTFSFRAQGFYSEIDVPWDVSSVEYAWLTEVVLGRLSGCFTPGQVLCSLLLEVQFLFHLPPFSKGSFYSLNVSATFRLS